MADDVHAQIAALQAEIAQHVARVGAHVEGAGPVGVSVDPGQVLTWLQQILAILAALAPKPSA